MVNTTKKQGLMSSFSLHVLAMALMLCDHIWGIVLMNMEHVDWMTCVGRIAFPIFAFMSVEGYLHTRNLKKYLLRLFVFGIVTEIPFDLGVEKTWFYPFHQNVLWTFFIGLVAMLCIELVKDKFISAGNAILTSKKNPNASVFSASAAYNKSSADGKPKKSAAFTILTTIAYLLISAFICVIAYLFGQFCFVDYAGAGVWLVLMFYFLRKDNLLRTILLYIDYKVTMKKPDLTGIVDGNEDAMDTVALVANRILQVLFTYFVFVGLMRGYYYDITVFGRQIEFQQEAFCLLAFIPIWLYKGRQGYHKKWFQYFCYAFYPGHIFLLWLIYKLIMLISTGTM